MTSKLVRSATHLEWHPVPLRERGINPRVNGLALTFALMLQFGVDERFGCGLLKSWHRCASSVSGVATLCANILGAITIAFSLICQHLDTHV